MGKARVYTREFRVNVVTRIFQGEKIADLSKELGIHRKLLYEWKQQVSEGGEASLRERGRPRKVDKVREAAESAERRITELEQLVGRQQLTIDFFRRALQRVEELRRKRGRTGAMASSRP